MSGGGQERGLRSGTLPAPLIVGLGKACEVSLQEMEVLIKALHILYLCDFWLFCAYKNSKNIQLFKLQN